MGSTVSRESRSASGSCWRRYGTFSTSVRASPSLLDSSQPSSTVVPMRLLGLVVVFTVLVFGICVGCSDAFAATYYTSPSGSDSNPGSFSLPFRTIQRCANIAVGGDTCFIRTGTYRETVRPSQSGSAGAPITFQAYPGDTVTLTGTDPVRGWTVDSGSIYKAPLSGTVNQVFV